MGISIGKKINFDGHIRKTCEKRGQKINALPRISTLLNKHKKGSF